MASSARNVLVGGLSTGEGQDIYEACAPASSRAFGGMQPMANQLGKEIAIPHEHLLDVGRHWIYTEIGGGTSNPAGVLTAPTATLPPRVIITSDGTQHRGAQIQYALAKTASGTSAGTSTANALFIPKAGYNIALRCRFRVTTTATNSSWVLGLCPVDTTMLASSVIDLTDLLGFYKPSGITVTGVVRTSSTSTSSTLTTAFTINDWHEAEMRINGVSSAEFWWNGAKVVQTTMTNIPTAELTLGFAGVGATAAAATFEIQSLVARQEAI